MRHVLVLSTACAASLLLLSCNSSQPTTPAAASMDETKSMTPVASLATRIDGADLLAGFHINIDPDTLSATVTPHRAGSAQPPQGQIYDLDIANFQNADSFRVTGVQVLGSGNFRISYSHAHPFPAPNLANPASGSNRADLGYTGRLLILTTYNPQSYFSNVVRMSAGAVVAPDGYLETGDLLANTGPGLVTAYPYKLLADEALDNRTGVSNGSNPEGSYFTAGGGWQRVNLGASGTGWTGFDYVHGGQTVTNQFTLSKDSLAASNFALDVALLIQYQDPRGAGGSIFRFPPTVIDPLQFAYRLPYAALDCSRVTPTASVIIAPAVGSSMTLDVRVRDWDATATEAADSKVGDEADISLVQLGGSGAPEVVLDAPGILAGLRNMGTPGSETGWSDNLLLYSNTLPNQEGATAGTYYACLRITDPEFDDAARTTYHAGVDATTLLPDAARAVPARTWQIVPITVGPDVPTISSVNPDGIVGGVEETVVFSAIASNTPTAWSWNFGGGATPNTSTAAAPQVQLASELGSYTGSVIATNAGGNSATFTFEYRVLEPQKPSWQSYNLAEYTAGAGDAGTSKNLILFNGKPVLTLLPEWKNGPIKLAIAQVPTPMGPEDWVIHDVISEFGRFPAPFIVNGKLAIVYEYDDANFRSLALAMAQVAAPDGPSDWTSMFAYDNTGEEGPRCSGMEFHGRIVLLHQIFGTGDGVAMAISSNLTPDGPEDFTHHLIEAGGQYPSMAAVSGESDDRLMVVYGLTTTTSLRVKQATVEFPTMGSDWTLAGDFTYPYTPQSSFIEPFNMSPSVIAANILWIDPVTHQPMHSTTTGYTTMGHQNVFPPTMLPGYAVGDEISFGTLNGRQAIGYSTSRSLGLTRAFRPEPSPIDWGSGSFIPAEYGLSEVSWVPAENAFLVSLRQTGPAGDFYTIAISSGPW